MKDLGSLHYFMGLEVYRSYLFLTHKKYDVDVLRKFKMDGVRPYSSRVISGSKLRLLDGDSLLDPSKYHGAVGALQYLTRKRPDIALATNKHASSCIVPLQLIGQ